jgi:molybdate transport system substrate-binding protein
MMHKLEYALYSFSLVLLVTAFAACAPLQPATGSETELVVFAASSLSDAFDELGDAFASQRDGMRITFNYAGSQQLAQQLASGAPADLFATANPQQMQVAVDARRIDASTVRPFARNRLVVVMPADNPAQIGSLADLAKPGVKLVIADAAVPVGAYTLAFLAKNSADPSLTAAYSPTVLANVVSYEENVRAVLSKVLLGEADAGIVYSSDVGHEVAQRMKRMEIPDELNQVATYPIAPLMDAPHGKLAREFVQFVISEQGQRILEDYGFIRILPD